MPELANNKKARFDYAILSELEGGLVLTGPEVKSAKGGHINLRGSFLTVDKVGRAWLQNAHIAAYPPAKGVQTNYDPYRPRQVLLKSSEIAELRAIKEAQGLTLVPLSIYTKNRLIKVLIGLAHGKRKADKRESIKQRDLTRARKVFGDEA